jgi:hypothetical protein
MTIALILYIISGSALIGCWLGWHLAQDRCRAKLLKQAAEHHGEVSRAHIRASYRGAQMARLAELAAELDAKGMRTHQEN